MTLPSECALVDLTVTERKINMKHYTRIIASLTLLLVALGTTATQASAPSGAITVTSRTGLVDGQTV